MMAYSPHRLGLATLLFAVALQGCGSTYKRNPVPEHLAFDASVPGIEGARMIGSGRDLEGSVQRRQVLLEQMRASGLLDKPLRFLAISGGGANGAFGAGLLVGWTETGDRPDFTLVTGVSTGALIAPFAFLGHDYDHVLREVYTTLETSDVIKPRGLLGALTSDAFADTTPLRELIARRVDEGVLVAIAREHEKGRRLYIGTTNLDLMQPVFWNIGLIAASGNPRSLDLIRDLLLASASIPGAFPPVYIEVEAGGERFDEMHVDGGASAQVFVYPLTVDMDEELGRIGAQIEDLRLFVIRNSRLEPTREVVEPKLTSIIGRSIAALIRSQGVGNLYEIYLGAMRDKFDFNLAYIPEHFTMESTEAFDPEYMSALFDLAYQLAKSGYPWEKAPPAYDPG
jgi:predicted acylesterase/phospholipase RssA